MSGKVEVREGLLLLLRGELGNLQRAQADAREAATHEEAKPENDKDTRALEASYLARGQAKRITELVAGIAHVEAMSLREFERGAPVALGAIVDAEEGDARHAYFLAPYGGGLRVAGVQVVTPQSPLGKALLGARDGDSCSVVLAGKTRELSIVGVK